MKRLLPLFSLLVLAHAAAGAIITVGSWKPIFQGVELATGRQQATLTGEKEHEVLCLRVDLTNPDIVLFTTPHCTNCPGYETLSENTGHFLEQYGLQVAVNGAFFGTSTGPSDTPLGTPDDVYGLAISLGDIVSPSDRAANAAALLFATNNTPFLVTNNYPGTNTTGIFTAISGDRPLLVNGINIQTAKPTDLDPRTALGISQDRRYLFLLTIDGRQGTAQGYDPPWSDGADWYNTGEWLKRFGAYNAINVDGGGSTTMVMADCAGGSVRLNRSSFVAQYDRERIIGHNFGLYAKPLVGDLKNFNVEPGTTTCLLTWNTEVPATTQVLFGPTTNYGSATTLDARLKRKHVATLNGLARGTTYYFRAVSTATSLTLTQECRFTTLTQLTTTNAFDLTQVWTYTTNNLNGVNWTARQYAEPGWLGSGPGLLYVETASYVGPRNTPVLPYSGSLPITYYFRTHFNLSGSLTGGAMTFSNYVDDGAVFYVNGAEAYRLRMPAAPTTIVNTTLANGYACSNTTYSGDAATVCPDVFTVTGSVLTNLAPGDNVLAVEVHNYSAGSPDIVFGSALFLSAPVSAQPRLNVWVEDNFVTLFWNAEGYTLQQATTLAGSGNWTNVPGPVTLSPYTVTPQGTKFYRLRQ